MRQLDVYARYAPPHTSDVAVVMLSTGGAHLPLPPLGTLGLDPARLVALPALPIPKPAGVASVSLSMPSLPGLAGVAIHAQALLIQDPLGAYLTNWTMDRIEP